MSEYLLEPEPALWPELDISHLFTIGEDYLLFRFYPSDGTHKAKWHEFRHWGPTANRFDHHPDGPPAQHPRHGVWYAALEETDKLGDPTGLYTAVAERFQDSKTVPLNDSTISLVKCSASRTLTLLDLESRWLTQAGGNAAIESGPRDRSRKWARAIRASYPHIDGLIWRSSVYRPGRAIALWDLPRVALARTAKFNRTVPELSAALIPAAKHIGYAISWQP